MATATAASPPGSPSPPPAPIALTPGPLATRLRSVYSNALTHTIRTCSYDNFAACFPTPAARTPRVLRAVWEQIVGKIEAKAADEFESILAEREVVRGLNELEALLGGAKARREARREGEGEGEVVPPHALPPTELYNAHLAPMLAPIQSELESRLRAKQARNEQLAESIRAQRTEIEALVGGLEAVVWDLEGANKVLGTVVEDEGLRNEVREVQAEVREAAKL